VPLLDVVESRDLDQFQQILLGALDRLKEIVSELRDESEIDIHITFRHKETTHE
jgi:hypothetical protein